MLNYSLRRWPNLEIVLGDCPVFAGVLGDAILPQRQKGHFPDNTVLWPNANVMLDHCLRHWANIIPTKTLVHISLPYIIHSRYLEGYVDIFINDILFSSHISLPYIIHSRYLEGYVDIFINDILFPHTSAYRTLYIPGI